MRNKKCHRNCLRKLLLIYWFFQLNLRINPCTGLVNMTISVELMLHISP